MKKTKRIELRVTPEQKESLKSFAAEHNISVSEYITTIILNPTSISHESHVSACIVVNKIINILRNYPELPNELKNQIVGELNTYVRY